MDTIILPLMAQGKEIGTCDETKPCISIVSWASTHRSQHTELKLHHNSRLHTITIVCRRSLLKCVFWIQVWFLVKPHKQQKCVWWTKNKAVLLWFLSLPASSGVKLWKVVRITGRPSVPSVVIFMAYNSYIYIYTELQLIIYSVGILHYLRVLFRNESYHFLSTTLIETGFVDWPIWGRGWSARVQG